MKTLLKILTTQFNIDFKIDELTSVIMDSRHAKKGALFFAINNGNNYIDEVLEKGVSLVIADNYSGKSKKVIKVQDTIKTMQKLAYDYRKKLKLKVIGITGSNGKTTTKDIIYSILTQKYNCKKTEGNYNNHIGLPFTILQAGDKDEVLVLEMGMSSIGEIDTLCKIACPDIGVITNIGDSHLEFLKTRENVFKAKSEIARYIDKNNFFVFGDDEYLKRLEAKKIGFSGDNDYILSDIKEFDTHCEFKFQEKEYRIPLNGQHNCINSAFGICIAENLGLSYDEIKTGLENINLTPMRFEKILCKNVLYINDAYNASPLSMECALDTFSKLYKNSFKIAVLGDMLELGENEVKFHVNIIKKALDIDCDLIYLYGENMRKALLLAGETEKIRFYATKEKLKREINNIEIDKQKIVLLKGSRGMKLEEIMDEEK